MKGLNTLLLLSSLITSSTLVAANEVDPQLAQVAAETIYHEQGQEEYGLDESYTQRTGSWKCIVQGANEQFFVSFNQDQETAITNAENKCKEASSTCKRISCHTN